MIPFQERFAAFVTPKLLWSPSREDLPHLRHPNYVLWPSGIRHICALNLCNRISFKERFAPFETPKLCLIIYIREYFCHEKYQSFVTWYFYRKDLQHSNPRVKKIFSILIGSDIVLISFDSFSDCIYNRHSTKKGWKYAPLLFVILAFT